MRYRFYQMLSRMIMKTMPAMAAAGMLCGNVMTVTAGGIQNGDGVVYYEPGEETAQTDAEDFHERIEIRTAQDLITFAQQCHIDSFSADKDVVLMEDIQLAGTGFTTIPIFCGRFEGNGHMITGYNYGGDGYVTGFFRYIGEGAVIENLHLSGTIRAEGKQQVTGGLCGINSGTITGCSFEGRIYGKSETGGIAGVNTADGEIQNSSNSSTIAGYYFTGGICGKNYGMIYGCSNDGNLNDSVEWITEEDEMNTDLLEDLTDSKTDVASLRRQSGTDTGGIAGYSRGAVIGCVNDGTIGYEHAGYNIGGIVGRQTGLIDNCSNRGMVLGRKDIGGIVGQMEPHLELDEEDSIHGDVNDLHDMVNQLTYIMDSDNAQVKADLESLRGYADAAVDTGDVMADQASGYVNQNADVVNEGSARLSHVLEMMPGVTANVTAAGDSADAMAEDLKKLNDHLHVTGNISEEDRQRLNGYADTIERSSHDIETAADRISGNISGDVEEYRTDTLTKPVGDSRTVTVMNAGTVLRCEGDHAYSIAKSAYSEEADFPEGWRELAGGRITLEDGYYYYLPASAVPESYRVVYHGQEKDVVPENAHELGVATTVSVIKPVDTSDSTDAVGDAGTAAAQMSDAMRGLYKEYTRILEGTSAEVHSDVEGALGEIEDAMDALDKAQASVNEITSYLNAQDDLEMIKVDQEWDKNVDSIHEQMDNMSAVMQRLGDHAQDYGEDVNAQIRTINDQINTIYNDIYNKVNERIDGIKEDNYDYIYADISDADLEHATLGKAAGCFNYGVVRGDVNVGGITGSMAIDEEDPEGNAAGSVQLSIGGRYTSRNIVFRCTNRGYVTSKNDGVGGIVGFMKNGVVSNAYVYGTAESTEGGYVGGVAGQSLAIIRDSYVLCTLSGNDNVGGVAGSGATITGCATMPTIMNCTGRSGAIAGQIAIDEDTQLLRLDQLSNNHYVSDALYGIDRISYQDAAEPLEYAELLAMPDTPIAFRYLTVTFRVDDKYLGTQRVNYGDDYSTITYPEIPAKEGFYGTWPEIGEGTIMGNMVITAEYADSVRVIESAARDEQSGKQLAMIDNDFNNEAKLSAQIVDTPAFQKAGFSDVVCYSVQIENSGKAAEDSFALRLYNPFGDKKISVWQYDGADWREVEYLERGSYVQVPMQGLEGIYCIAVHEKDLMTIAKVGGGAAAVLVLVIALVTGRKKKKTTKGNAKETDTE
ncbi:MAG: hypothetical protein IKO10_17950 [Lachnospiraceae bacterium]|nr:hypothetical protein [Lachnospiraceae bacterium]